MTAFSLILALILEQARPVPHDGWVATPLARLAQAVERAFNGGERYQAALAWALVVVGGAMLVGVAGWMLGEIASPLGWLWGVLVLYVTMGFRQFSHYFTDIHFALRTDDLESARRLLDQWRGRHADEPGPSTIARLAIETGLTASHRHVFAVILWFTLLGPAGAVLYRLSASLADAWSNAEEKTFAKFAGDAFAWVDWLPQRMTAIGFAVVGNFEDAVHCWRTQAGNWPKRDEGILLAAGAGALGVRLGEPLLESGELTERSGLGVGEDADVGSMQTAIGLVWRTLVLWILLLLLVGLAHLAG
jgi:adenosylcobinamide-phosphate synthase